MGTTPSIGTYSRRCNGSRSLVRNAPGGYWIAEADPQAADHAVTASFDVRHVVWAVLCTDGAERPLQHLGLVDWPAVASMTDAELTELLQRAHAWEAEHDPTGRELPRAKRHDDKSIISLTLSR